MYCVITKVVEHTHTLTRERERERVLAWEYVIMALISGAEVSYLPFPLSAAAASLVCCLRCLGQGVLPGALNGIESEREREREGLLLYTVSCFVSACPAGNLYLTAFIVLM